MNSLLIAPAEPKLLPKTSAAFSVVMAYDEAIAGRTATRLYRRLVGQFGIELEFRYHSWNFQELKNPSTAEEAALFAAEANLIIVATVNSDVLPWQVKAWIEESISQKQDESALAVLVGNTTSAKLPNMDVNEHLRSVAEEANVTFFSTVFEVPNSATAYSLVEPMKRYEAPNSVLEEILNRPPPPPRWGINE